MPDMFLDLNEEWYLGGHGKQLCLEHTCLAIVFSYCRWDSELETFICNACEAEPPKWLSDVALLQGATLNPERYILDL